MLPSLLVPILILLLAYVVSTIVISYFYRKVLGMSMRESLLSAMPAGAADIALISSELGVFESRVIVIQVLRLVIVLILYPIIYTLLL